MTYRDDTSQDGYTTARSGDPFRSVELALIDDTPEAWDLVFDALVVRGTVTDDHPARVRVTLTNESSIDWQIAPGPTIPFSSGPNVGDGPIFYLRRPENSTETKTSGCWELEPPVLYPSGVTFASISPEETVATEFDLWGTTENDGCFPRGRYRFEESYGPQQLDADDTDATTNESTDFTWGFEIEVT